jgi:hypothetical protein
MCATMTGRLWRPERSEKTTRGRHAGVSAAGKEASCRLGTILLAQDMHTRPEGLTGSPLTSAANEPVIGMSLLIILCGLLIGTLLLGV